MGSTVNTDGKVFVQVVLHIDLFRTVFYYVIEDYKNRAREACYDSQVGAKA